jgi:hypothetical protein
LRSEDSEGLLRAKKSVTEASKPLLSIPLDNLLSDNILSYPEQQLGLGPHAKNSALHNPLSSKHRDINYWIALDICVDTVFAAMIISILTASARLPSALE